MELFEYLDKIVEFHLAYSLPKEIYIYNEEQCKYLSGLMTYLHTDRMIIFHNKATEEPTIERIYYAGFTFFLANIV